MKNDVKSAESQQEVVLTFLDALNAEDFTAARKCLQDDFTFDGVMGSVKGADEYIRQMKDMRLKYKIKKSLGDASDVSVFYDIDMSGKSIFSAGWYHLQHDKIKSAKVVFDPRPMLEKPDKK